MSSSRTSRVVFATLATVSLLVACAAGTSSSSSSSSSGSSGSTGDGGVAAQCATKGTPKQGPGVGPAYTFADLPNGACTAEPSCGLNVFGPCFGNPDYVGYPLNVYQCDCTAGTWSCFVKFAGGSVCVEGGAPLVDGAAPPDAGDGGVR